MEILTNHNQLNQSIKKELELASITDKNRATPDLSWLLPEIKSTIIDELLLHTRGNQAKASRMLGISRCTLRKIYNQRFNK